MTWNTKRRLNDRFSPTALNEIGRSYAAFSDCDSSLESMFSEGNVYTSLPEEGREIKNVILLSNDRVLYEYE